MQCPFCFHDQTQVKETRFVENKKSIRRRRYCMVCDSRFTTFEKPHFRFSVIKRNCCHESFDDNKIAASIRMVSKKRPVHEDQIQGILANVRLRIEKSGRESISSKKIGRMVEEGLKHIDVIAYIRFASVYWDIKSFEDYQKMIETLK